MNISHKAGCSPTAGPAGSVSRCRHSNASPARQPLQGFLSAAVQIWCVDSFIYLFISSSSSIRKCFLPYLEDCNNSKNPHQHLLSLDFYRYLEILSNSYYSYMGVF